MNLDKQIESAYNEYKALKEKAEIAKKESTLAYNKYRELVKIRTNNKVDKSVLEKIQNYMLKNKDEVEHISSLVKELNFKEIINRYIEALESQLQKECPKTLSLEQKERAIANIMQRLHPEIERMKLLLNLSNEDIVFNLIRNFEIYRPSRRGFGYLECLRCIGFVESTEHTLYYIKYFLP